MHNPSEFPVLFGPDDVLMGVVTTPATGTPVEPVACLMYNMGANPRIGPRRINVKLARQLAGVGVSSLRFDLTGMGDSRASREAKSSSIQAVSDVRAAMDHVEATLGIRQFVIVGLCSGVPSAIKAAVEDTRVIGVVQFDGYAFPDKSTRRKRTLRRLLALPFNPAMRSKMMGWLRRRFGAPNAREAEIFAPEAPEDHAGTFRHAMNVLADRKIPTLLLYTGTLDAKDRHKDQLGSMARERFAQHADYVFRADMDHGITSLQSQQSFLRLVGDWTMGVVVAARPGTSPATAPSAPHRDRAGARHRVIPGENLHAPTTTAASG